MEHVHKVIYIGGGGLLKY